MRKIILVILINCVLFVFGCQDVNNGEETVTIRIMAAASLTEVFTELKNEFESSVEDINLEINFAGSQALYSQIQSGVSADIFASANIKYMHKLEEADMAKDSTVFAHNKLVAAVSKSTSYNIESFVDLLDSGVKLVIADESVPAGRYTLQMLEKQKGNPEMPSNFQDMFLANVISKQLDVKSIVAKLELGEADAGIVYKTDINSSNMDKVRIVDIKDEYNVIANYPISIIKGISSEKEEVARKFLDYLYSLKGERILEKHGFIKESRG